MVDREDTGNETRGESQSEVAAPRSFGDLSPDMAKVIAIVAVSQAKVEEVLLGDGLTQEEEFLLLWLVKTMTIFGRAAEDVAEGQIDGVESVAFVPQ